ncbi:MAG: tRNA (N6-threonylcarbamoyladenosine(37)-N6)-methyltransferase TrmO [Chloroflexota bacterium]|jgi:tRNA-Thr(GGU) m(6)t(6)A37 methyltransferase TsaA
MDLRPVGVVRSPVADLDQMPFEGVPARLEIFPQFQEAMEAVEESTHIIVIGWFHKADRETLRLSESRRGPLEKPHGVFSLRSPNRPNPLGMLVCRLEKVEGDSLYLEKLDFVDGTPIVDVKPYSPSWDCVFAARSSRDLTFVGESNRRSTLDRMVVEAANFHGEACLGVALGARIMAHTIAEWKVAQKDPEITVHMGDNGCIADALQALTGATLGNGRMKVPSGRAFRLAYGKKKVLAFQPRELPEGFGVEDALQAGIDDLFVIRSEVYAEGSGPHGGRPPKRQPPEEKRQMLLERVQQSLVEGRLPCAAAHHLAHELGVSVSDIGWAADESGARITKCQLGCFK